MYKIGNLAKLDYNKQAYILEVDPEESGERLDKFVTARVGALSRSFVQQLIEAGHVRVQGRARKANYRVVAGETVTVTIPPPSPVETRGQDIPLAIVYEDDALLVVNKPAGMVVHPAAGHASGTLVNAVLWHAPEMVVGNAERPGIVHRLDRDTSGLLVIARQDEALHKLQAQFASREVHKTYLALVQGRVAVAQGRIDAPLGRDPHDRKKIAVVTRTPARSAVTLFHVTERLEDYTLLRVEPQTGRTHQIRVHLAFIHHPIAGDAVYGGARKNKLGLERQFLHAWRLAFIHPMTGQPVEFSAALPPDLREALEQAGGDPSPWI
ncbi:MAG: RluA family pseudouridine synthase [Anaerolineae bacterium]